MKNTDEIIAEIPVAENPLSKQVKPNDVAILQLLADGNTTEEIGKKTYKSFRTIEGRIARLKDLLDCKTMAQLVAVALRNKIIE